MSTLCSFQGQGELYVGSGTVTISALAAAAEEDLTITDSNIATTDVVIGSFANADMETGVGVLGVWCSAAGTIKLRITNASGSGLTGGSATFYYCIIKTSLPTNP
jgi:hypothetical protein